uniref:NADH-ubiquinone oxidoreductase chain 4L n=1 Tax=Gondwanalimnadia sp. MT-2020 TaxID=2731355 RepID=A0A6M4SPE7_9CRUS|nr:NADH dehydrogenase subunit 4L [Gondwanalimnadia sp. MT-2020]
MLNKNDIIMFLPLLSLTASIYVLCSQNKHLLVSLLSLESAVLSLFFIIVNMSTLSSSSFSLVFITLAVCEAALGLSILISVVRTHNNDFVNSLNLY